MMPKLTRLPFGSNSGHGSEIVNRTFTN
jgi:hypothetical protein